MIIFRLLYASNSNYYLYHFYQITYFFQQKYKLISFSIIFVILIYNKFVSRFIFQTNFEFFLYFFSLSIFIYLLKILTKKFLKFIISEINN
jgi:hypothetical protein